MEIGGQLGNKNATKSKPWSEAIAKFAKQNPDKRDKLIAKLYEMALEGNMLAIKEIVDRTDGKAIQGVEVDVAVTEHRVISSKAMDLSEWEAAQNPPANDTEGELIEHDVPRETLPELAKTHEVINK